jgi:hypothetical protein
MLRAIFRLYFGKMARLNRMRIFDHDYMKAPDLGLETN